MIDTCVFVYVCVTEVCSYEFACKYMQREDNVFQPSKEGQENAQKWDKSKCNQFF